MEFNFETMHQMRERSLGRALWRMKRHYDKVIETWLHAQGFTDVKVGYLVFLGNLDKDGVSGSDLARKAVVTKQAMSKTIKELEALGYVTIQRDANDGRAQVIYLSERGKVMFLELKNCVSHLTAKMNFIVGEARMEAMLDTMLTLLNHLEKEQ
jgi:DNA-binding MarR family transcriptional regulator